MKYLRLSLIVLFISINLHAQKVKISKEVVSIDKVEMYLMVKTSYDRFSFSIKNLEGEEIFFVKAESYKDSKEVSQHNKDGSVSYFSILDVKTNKVIFEHELSIGSKKRLFKLIYNEELIKNGKLNEDVAERLSIRIGKPFSRKREELCD